ncbi:hypothetical protein L9F63_004681 [Diploptera punctata]|uniref:Uncharacterized protein n=1 Tax=Diploptera punctata TaxID=6984 RepID=A0AAD8E763_DIPPU|nr:hypothetical protein L9F63_004681 [Diploptera punctata]
MMQMEECCRAAITLNPASAGSGNNAAPGEWDIEMDIREHIQQCSCTCNHMGYGNYMDYQVKSHGENLK